MPGETVSDVGEMNVRICREGNEIREPSDFLQNSTIIPSLDPTFPRDGTVIHRHYTEWHFSVDQLSS